MRHQVRIHYDNQNGFLEPTMWVWVSDGATLEREVKPRGKDNFGYYYEFEFNRSSFNFIFKDGEGSDVLWEDESLNRSYHIQMGTEIWSMADRHNIYQMRPAEPVGIASDYYKTIKDLVIKDNFYFPTTDVSGMGIPSMLGANILKDGSILFGIFHPRAARVYLVGNFNNWQCPGHSRPRKKDFIEMELYRGFYFKPNIWLVKLSPRRLPANIEYKFYIQGGAQEFERFVPDPYTRVYSDDYKYRNSVVVNPTKFKWTDHNWVTPEVKDLILYELNVYGFTDNDPDIEENIQGTFKGVTQRIKNGYFNELGVTAIALMPTAEVPVKKGLGYEPCTFMAVEKDFGTPDDFREMINEAHNHGLAVLIDQVFNHTSNDFNPLWDLIDDNSGRGGFYFAGETMWGNKVATGIDEVDNMLIDSCKLFIKEYHVDGFRFDATHSFFLNHKLLHRLAHEITDKGFKRDVILIAENLPNEKDLNREGYNGYAQWSNIFHDKLKALLREGEFENIPNDTSDMGTMIYFSKDRFAAHTNNVINYVESHDENSVHFEVATGGEHLQNAELKNRKARLGLLTTMVALGQPMIYMGQEFGIERERNRIKVAWHRHSEDTSKFYQWTKGIINLRKNLDSLKLNGYNPVDNGEMTWIMGPWFDDEKRGANRRVVGWRARAGQDPSQELVIMLNYEGHDVPVNVDLQTPGKWIKLADIDSVKDYTSQGEEEAFPITTEDGKISDFILPPYSGFIYRLESGQIQ